MKAVVITDFRNLKHTDFIITEVSFFQNKKLLT